MLQAMIRHYADGHKSKFARKLGISPQCLATWLSRNTFDIELIFAKCDHLNPAWLFTGEVTMLLNADTSNYNQPNSIPSHEGIPLLTVDAMSGVLTSELHKVKDAAKLFHVPTFRGANFFDSRKGEQYVSNIQRRRPGGLQDVANVRLCVSVEPGVCDRHGSRSIDQTNQAWQYRSQYHASV